MRLFPSIACVTKREKSLNENRNLTKISVILIIYKLKECTNVST